MVTAMEPKTMQKAVQISGALTDEAVRNGSIKKVEKRGSVGEPSKDMSGRDDNKRTRTVNAFATTINPVGRENTGTWPKCTIYNSFNAPGGLYRICYNYNRPGHLARDCRSVPRNVTQLLGHVMSVVVPTMSGQLALGEIEHKDREKIVQIKLLLITGVMVVETVELCNLMIKPRTRVRCGL
ncbi:reverse transcriptase domain-containing protein [Tanacetum coccineum]